MSLVSQFFGGTSTRKIPLKILVVGGGGGSGGVLAFNGNANPHPGANSGDYSGSGGGGGVGVINNYWIGPGTVCPITIGSGGAAGVGIGSTTLTQGGNGGTSLFQDPTGETFTLIGGGGGGGSYGNASNPGASQPLRNGLSGGCGGGGAYVPGPGGTVSSGLGANGNYFKRASKTNGAYGTFQYLSNESLYVGIDNGYGTNYGFPAAFEPYIGPAAPGNASYYNYAGGSGGGTDNTSSINDGGNTLVSDAFYNPNTNSNGLLNNITGILTSYACGGRSGGGVGRSVWTPTMPTGPSPGGIMNPAPGIAKTATANSGSGGISVSNAGLVPGPNISYSWGGPGITGAAGVVVVSYPSAFAAASSFPGASDISPQTPGYRTYQFTSPGSITLP